MECVASKPVVTAHGEFMLHAFEDKTTGGVHLALVKGDIAADQETLVRVHEPLSVVDFLDMDGGRHTF